MKKLAAIFVSFVYLVLSTGVLINLHYCQGEIESISVIVNSSNCCCASSDFEDGCCKNESFVIQFDAEDHVISNTYTASKNFKIIEKYNSLEFLWLEDFSNKVEENLYQDISPPPKLAIWKTNCTYLFYG